MFLCLLPVGPCFTILCTHSHTHAHTHTHTRTHTHTHIYMCVRVRVIDFANFGIKLWNMKLVDVNRHAGDIVEMQDIRLLPQDVTYPER